MTYRSVGAKSMFGLAFLTKTGNLCLFSYGTQGDKMTKNLLYLFNDTLGFEFSTLLRTHSLYL